MESQVQSPAENLQRDLTFGEKAVGITFNPGGNPVVEDIKRRYADIIDRLNDFRNDPSTTPGAARHASAAITDAETAQMRAVKAVTFPY